MIPIADKKKEAHFHYVLRLADNCLILGHRLSEWCGKGPQLEEDIALINIALDHIGRARSLYDYAALLQGLDKTQDDLAYRRDAWDFKNNLLLEQTNGDYAKTIVRSFLYDVFAHGQYRALASSTDETLRAIAEKSNKEIAYHLVHSKEWMLRLGDGTAESNARTNMALNELWKYTGDLFVCTPAELPLIEKGVIPDPELLKTKWHSDVQAILDEAGLVKPVATFMQSGSQDGKHTEHLGYLLAEMQFLQRAYPDAVWD
jgi:ring-1,2-phenylacetyl-CoA epoxidase subunit PaaC